jgi:N-glycosylase/DNA lyase
VKVTLQNWIDADKRQYRVREYGSDAGVVGIKDALEKGVTGILHGVTEKNKDDIFYMLCFCLAVPQSKAVKVNHAIEELRKRDFLNVPISESDLSELLYGRVRFHNNKAKYLVLARTVFLTSDFWEELKVAYAQYAHSKSSDDVDASFIYLRTLRRSLVKRFKGFGYKESGHFLRNIGMSGLAILDVHIMDGLRKRGLIADTPLTNATYCDIEDTMRQYAAKVGVTIDELDLLLWSQKTGFVFK